MIGLKVTLPLRTKNLANMQTGNSRLAGIIRTRQRRIQREATRAHVLAAVKARGVDPSAFLPARITITRISAGKLDRWDGLGNALKACIDGTADVFGLRDDDARFDWRLAQRKGPPKTYEVEVLIERRTGT